MNRIVRNYGGGGKPKPDECRCVTVSFTCENCKCHVAQDDRFCKHCGARFVGVVDEGEERTIKMTEEIWDLLTDAVDIAWEEALLLSDVGDKMPLNEDLEFLVREAKRIRDEFWELKI